MRPFLIAAASGTLVSLSLLAGLFHGQELFFEDRLFSPKRIDPRIVILAVDDRSIQEIGAWPWPREIWSRVIDKLAEKKPAVFGLDVILSEPSLRGSGDDAALSASLANAQFPIVMPKEDSGLSPLPLFTQHKSVSLGLVNFITDPDGVVRRLSLADSFALAVAKHGKPAIEDIAEKTSRIAYAGSPRSVRTISIYDFLSGKVALPHENMIVLAGATASNLHDTHAVPTSGGEEMAGVEVQAQTANMLLSGYRLAPLSQPLSVAWIFLLSLIPALFFSRLPRSAKPVLASAALGLTATIIGIIAFDRGMVINLVHTNFAWILSTAALFTHRYFTTEKERREMRHAFSKYVSKDILEEMLRDPSKVKLGGEERKATVFFSDVRGFTTLSEALSATGLVSYLNRYYNLMSGLVIKHHGVVDKYIGDAIMSFWGAPVENKNQALDAVIASLAMIEGLHAFNEEESKNGAPKIDIGIGLNTGTVVAGNVGSTERFDYTVMGDTTNLASRLEGQTKTYGVHIIVSKATRDEITPEMEREHSLLFREIDKIKVKGKTLPVTIFECVERARQEAVSKSIAQFNEARELYYSGEFKKAAEIFTKISAADPADGPTKLLLERCKYFLEHAPEKWEGVYEFKTK